MPIIVIIRGSVDCSLNIYGSIPIPFFVHSLFFIRRMKFNFPVSISVSFPVSRLSVCKIFVRIDTNDAVFLAGSKLLCKICPLNDFFRKRASYDFTA